MSSACSASCSGARRLAKAQLFQSPGTSFGLTLKYICYITFTASLTRPLTHSLTHLLTGSLTNSLTNALTNSRSACLSATISNVCISLPYSKSCTRIRFALHLTPFAENALEIAWLLNALLCCAFECCSLHGATFAFGRGGKPRVTEGYLPGHDQIIKNRHILSQNVSCSHLTK